MIAGERGQISITIEGGFKRATLTAHSLLTLGDLTALVTELTYEGMPPASLVRVDKLKVQLDGRRGNPLGAIIVEQRLGPALRESALGRSRQGA